MISISTILLDEIQPILLCGNLYILRKIPCGTVTSPLRNSTFSCSGILTGKSVKSGKNRPRLIQIDLATARSIFHNLGQFFPESTSLPVNIPIKVSYPLHAATWKITNFQYRAPKRNVRILHPFIGS